MFQPNCRRVRLSRHASFISLSWMRAELIFPSPSLDALSSDVDVILILATLHGQKAHNCCHRGGIDDFTRVGHEYHDLANSEFMAHRCRSLTHLIGRGKAAACSLIHSLASQGVEQSCVAGARLVAHSPTNAAVNPSEPHGSIQARRLPLGILV